MVVFDNVLLFIVLIKLGVFIIVFFVVLIKMVFFLIFLNILLLNKWKLFLLVGICNEIILVFLIVFFIVFLYFKKDKE